MRRHTRIFSSILALIFLVPCLATPFALALKIPSEPATAPTFDGTGTISLPSGMQATIDTPQGPLTTQADVTVTFEITVEQPRVFDIGYQLDGVDHFLYIIETPATQFTGAFQMPAGASYRIHNASTSAATITGIHFE